MTPPPPEPSERVPLKSKLAWALGSLGDNYANQTPQQLITPVFNVALGMPADMLANALSAPRFIDSFADPTVGYLSDNARTRWGRRRPFILAGAVPLALIAALLFLPGSTWSHSALAWWVSISTFFYYLAYAIFIVPYRALGFELATDPNERTRVQGWGMIFGLIGGLGIPWLYKLTLLIGGVDPNATNIPPETVLGGARWVGVGVGLLILLTCTAPAFLCRERAMGPAHAKISIRQALLQTLRNWPFFNMVIARTFVLIATFAVGGITTPLIIYYLYGGNQSAASTLQGVAGNLLFAGAAIGIPFNTAMSTRIGKRAAFIVCLLVATSGILSQALTLRPEHPYWLLASQFVLGFGLQGVWLMCQSMVADVCDEDQLRTGHRREGIYGAAYALMEKLGVTAGVWAGGVTALFCGYSAGHPAPDVLHRMWLAVIWIPAAGMVLAAGLIAFYPLTAERMAAIRGRLSSGGGSDA